MRFFFPLSFLFCFFSPLRSQQVSLVDSSRQAAPFLKPETFGDSHMNVLFNTSFTSDVKNGSFDRLHGNINYLKWELKGRFFKDFSYHFRQSLTKSPVSGETDKAVVSVDYANIGWQVTPRFSLTAGKQLLDLGGYEFWVSGYRVQEFSEFNDCMNNYGTGLMGLFQIDADQSVSVQVVDSKTGSDDETFPYGLPEGVDESKFPLLATFNWDTWRAGRKLNLRYSVSAGQQAKGRGIYYFTGGHVWKDRNLLAYLDLNLSVEGVDHKGLVSSMPVWNNGGAPQTAQHTAYFTAIADVDWRIGSHWNVFAKAIYEQGGVTASNGIYQKGVYFHEWQAQLCAEFYPREKLDLKLYFHALYKQRLSTGLSSLLGAENENLQRCALGIVYAIPVF